MTRFYRQVVIPSLPHIDPSLVDQSSQWPDSEVLVMKRIQLLFVTDAILYPLDRGNRIRIFNLLTACTREFEVTLVAPRPSAADMTMLPKRITRTVFIDPNESTPFDWGRFRRALGSAIGLPVTRTLFARMRLLRALQELNLDDFGLIWAEQPHIGRMFNAHRARTIVDFDDVNHRRLSRLIQLQGWSVARLRSYYPYWVYRRAELRAFRKYLRVIVCSKEDQDYLETRGAGNVRVAPNGTAIARLIPSVRIRASGTLLRTVYLGNMSGRPNIDAVRFFADQVLPRAQGLIESFDVIGSKASPELMRDYGERVRFRGFVEDLSSALCEYDVMVVPIRFGSGTKLKVLDAFASGVPVVSTPYGVEGLDVIDGVHVLIASTPDEMLHALERLARSEDLSRELGQRAHDLARERYSWEAIQMSLAKELTDAVREWGGPPREVTQKSPV